MVVSSLWRELGNIHGFIQVGQFYRQKLATARAPNLSHRFWCEGYNAGFMYVQPHHYCV